MRTEQINAFFNENYSEILKFADKIYYGYLREFESVLQPEDFLTEFYIYAIDNKYRIKQLSVIDIINPEFIRTIRYKYRFEITNIKKFDKLIADLNKVARDADFNVDILTPALYILTKDDYNKRTKSYIKAKKIIERSEI